MSLFNELKRRNVFRVGVAYAVVAWLLLQVADTLLPAFEAPGWVMRVFATLVILGFPLAIIFAWAFELTPEGIKPTNEIPVGDSVTPQTGLRLNAVILGAVVLAVGFLLFDRYSEDSAALTPETSIAMAAPVASTAPTQRTSLVLPQQQPMVFGWIDGHSLAISPDGNTVAYVALDSTGTEQGNILNVRELGSLQFRSLPGTEGARQPFFSPDGQWLGFFTRDGVMKKVSLAGGRAITLSDDINGSDWAFATWLENNTIVYSAVSFPMVLKGISADGGEVRELTSLDETAGERNHKYPEAIPGTDIVLFQTNYLIENQVRSKIEAIVTSTGERRLILDGVQFPRYLANGYLLFRRDEVNMVAPFDPEALAFTGPAIPIVDEIRRDGSSGSGLVSQLAVSGNGTLAYAPPVNTLREIYLVSRDGSSESLGLRADYYGDISVSADGRYAALEVQYAQESEAFLYDFIRATTTSLSQEAPLSHSPFWRPDSQATVLTTPRNSTGMGLWLSELDGSKRQLLEFPSGSYVLRNGSWHPDGRQFAITRQAGSEHDIMLVSVPEDESETVAVEPLLAGTSAYHSPRFSPDGRWLAYVSDKSGKVQVYIRRFPEGEELIASTGESAQAPLWSADGSELFFAQQAFGENLRNMAMSAVLVSEAGNSLQVSQPESLFTFSQANENGVIEDYAVGGNGGTFFGVLPDGRFLMARGQSAAIQHEIVLVQNWFTELQAMAPVE